MILPGMNGTCREYHVIMQIFDAIGVIRMYMPEPQATVVTGVTFGYMRGLDATIQAAFIETGTIHVAALSGMNITIVAGGTILLLSRWFSRRISIVLSMISTIGFIWFVGPSASLVRAGVMAIFAYSSTLLGRQYAPIAALCLTTFGMLIIYPSYIVDSGFWLSVLATLGILLFPYTISSKQVHVPPSIPEVDASQQTIVLPENLSISRSVLESLWHAIRVDLHTTLAAQVFTFPYILFAFHRLSLIAPVANILIGFVIPPIMVLGMVLAFLGMVLPFVAYPIGWILWVLSSYVLWVVTTLARIPYAGIEW